MKIKRIVIVGMGLMGGSLAAACKRHCRQAAVVGVSRSPQALRYARRKGWIDEGHRHLAKAVAKADFVVLCTPVDTLPHLLKELDLHASSGTIVTDVGSVKADLFKKISRCRWKNIRFAASHPMVGSHKSGVRASDPFLYDGGLVFVIQEGKESLALRRVKAFWRLFTHRVTEVGREEHDLIVGEISHLPHAVASCLMLACNPRSLRFAASGFRSTTRVAAAPFSVWLPIFMSNRKALAPVMRRFEGFLRDFRKAVARGDSEAIKEMLEDASLRRKEI